MSNITDWIKYELYPSLFNHIDRAFPEHRFTRFNGGWRSNTYLDGSPHKRADKTVVNKSAFGFLLEQGGEVIGIIDYVMRRDGKSFIDSVKTLAEIAGLPLPDNSDYDADTYQRYKAKITLLEECNSYFVYCLEHSSSAEPIREYLRHRGYSVDDIKAMELGYIPSQEKLVTYLMGKGYQQSTIDSTLKLTKAIGESHQLTIPYRSGSVIKGFKFRTIGDATPKYLNSTGLDRDGGFFNLTGVKGDKDVVVVEGELDSLHATVKGISNVVATGGSSITLDQVKDAVRRGAQSLTICFDTEPENAEKTKQNVSNAIQVILSAGVNRVYVVSLTDLGNGKTDLDRFIKERGIEAFQHQLTNALPYYKYLLSNLLEKHIPKHGASPIELSSRRIDSLLDEVIRLGVRIPNAIDRDIYKKQFISLDAIQNFGITEESISLTIERLTTSKEKEYQTKELKKMLSKASNFLDKGEIDSTLDLLDNQSKQIKLSNNKAIFEKLTEIPSIEDLKRHFSQHSESLKTGYMIDGSELLLPSGGLTGIAGATGHGKTDFLINLTLNSVKNYPDKEFYFFTYEMSQEAILVRFLNSYLDKDLEIVSNQRAIKNFFKTGSTQYIRDDAKEHFIEKVEEFFKVIIGSGRLKVKGIDFTAPELNSALSALNKRGNVGGYFVDYFQLLNLPKEGYKNYSRQEELKVICQDLNRTAKELQVPIILGAQFNREVTTPFRLHPTNISEAGDIERILDTLIGIWFTNKKMVDKDLTKAEQSEIKNKGLNAKDKLYTYILKSRETATDVGELLDYNGKRGVIKNSQQNHNPFK